MFEDALLDSSPRQKSVLRRVHYLVSTLAGVLFLLLGLCVLPLVLAPAGWRGLLVAATVLGVISALDALMFCYVWADARQQNLLVWPWLVVTLVLNLAGFLSYLIYSAWKSGEWRRAAIPLAYVTETMFVGALVLVPLIRTQALPTQLLFTGIHLSPPPGPRPASPAGRPAPPARHPRVNPFAEPTTIPPTVARIVEPPEPPRVDEPVGVFVTGALPGDRAGKGTISGGAPWNVETPAPPPPSHVATAPQFYRVGGDVIAARALFRPRPVYPPLAVMARVQGTVVLQAILGKDGRVQDLKVLSGHPLLVRAAMDAVKTWRYQPTQLNSEPVDVLTEIDVNFTLGE